MTPSPTPTLPALRLSTTDHQKLRLLVETAMRGNPRERTQWEPLQHELARAQVLPAAELPGDVVTMGSTVEIEDSATGERDTYTLVFPEHADGLAGRLSILAPIGMAIIGFAQGDTFTWKTPGGPRRLRLRRVTPPPRPGP
jgi:regulator of nucleoside diphosphate kinase